MKLSVGYSFAEGLLEKLAAFPEVAEVYGKMDADIFGGGRSSYTFSPVSKKDVRKAVDRCHQLNIKFNYLLNAAYLHGLEQTRKGQKQIRGFLDFLDDIKVDNITVASPFLLRLIKSCYPRFSVRIGVFAMVDTPLKALEWEGLGADTICVGAIACNRDFKRLAAIRKSVKCNLELIANAGCLLQCAYEPTHMQMLTQSSSTRDPLKGFCLDYCFLHCSSARLQEPVNYIRSTWIRPEDLHVYEDLGYDHFKIVERSSPPELIVKRVKAYSDRSFNGNLLEIVGPVARIKKEQGLTWFERLRLIKRFFRPGFAKLSGIKTTADYAEFIIPHQFDEKNAGVYIDNRKLDGFLEGITKRGCTGTDCGSCTYCAETAKNVVRFRDGYREKAIEMAGSLEKSMHTGSLWE
ncbi:MAG: U32 family peptidase [Fibrobacteres bacterium]|nr:U32 family peptidase [Fibrobacterota bacterium]